MTYHELIRIPSKFSQFWNDRSFVDCILVTSTAEIKCHQLVLASQSKWFNDYFRANKHPPRTLVRIEVPYDPENLFAEFIEFFYTGKVKITSKNTPYLLKMANFYGTPFLITILRGIYHKHVNEVTVLDLVKKFNELELYEDADSLTFILAPILISLILNPYRSKSFLTIQSIFEGISPRLLSTILNSKEMAQAEKQFKKHLTDKLKVQYIDEFVTYHPKITNEEKEFLASTINWAKPDAYLHMVRGKCEWVPARISRRLFNQVLTIRRSKTILFSSNFDKANKDTVSRWYPFMWISDIAKTKNKIEQPIIRFYHFFTTLGGIVNRINPQQYYLIQTLTNVSSLSANFEPRFLLEKDSYFVARTDLSKAGAIVGFDFGSSAQFVPLKVKIDCHVVQSANKSRKPPENLIYSAYPTSIEIKTLQNLNELPKTKGKTVKMKKDKRKIRINKEKKGYQYICLQVYKPNSKGGSIWKLRKVDFKGYFIA